MEVQEDDMEVQEEAVHNALETQKHIKGSGPTQHTYIICFYKPFNFLPSHI